MKVFPLNWQLNNMRNRLYACLGLIAEFFVIAMSYLDYTFIPFQQELPDVEQTLIIPQAPVRPVVEQLWDFFRANRRVARGITDNGL